MMSSFSRRYPGTLWPSCGDNLGITFEPLGDFGKIGGDISIQNMRYGRFNEGNLELLDQVNSANLLL